MSQPFGNKLVAVSDNPSINKKTKFYQLNDSKVKFKTDKSILYFKYMKDEIFFSIIEEKNFEINKRIISQSELGAIPCRIFANSIKGRVSGNTSKDDRFQYFILADKGKKLFLYKFEESADPYLDTISSWKDKQGYCR